MSISRYLSQFADFLNSSGVLGISGGGTGLTSTPSNGQLDIGNGTGFTRATLTAGTGVTITNGAGTITIASTAGVASDRQVFNASGTWTKPSSGTYAVIQIWGAGAGGGAAGVNGGGGGGGYSSVTCLLTDLTATVSVTLNSGGAANANGGTTTFGSYLTQTGGGTGRNYASGCSSAPMLGRSGYLSASSGLTIINAAVEYSTGTFSTTYSNALYNNNIMGVQATPNSFAPGSGATVASTTIYNSAGTSVFGGAGGTGTASAGGAGSAPGGGGGSGSSSSGAGAIGRVIVTVF